MGETVEFTDEEGTVTEFYIIEKTRVNNTDYLLVTDNDDEEAEEAQAYILKDTSDEEAEEAVYVMVSDPDEFESVTRIFRELVDDAELV